MRSATHIAGRPEFSIHAVECRDDHRAWSAPVAPNGHRIVLVRSGRFRRRGDGVAADIDRTVGYFGLPGDEERFAHPAGGDVTTAVSLAPSLWRSVAGEGEPRGRTVYVGAAVELAHRRILAASAAGEVDFGVVEQLLALLAGALTPHDGAPAAVEPATARAAAADRRLVAQARQAVLADDPAARGLLPLAGLLDVSPYRLSRAFSREMGVSLTWYRNRVRVGRVLDRVEEGDRSLAAVAADLGFADQAHLTRTVRAHLGHPPGALRSLLATAPQQHGFPQRGGSA